MKGFLLVKLTVAAVALGGVTMASLPHISQAVERTKAAQAYTYLSSLRAAQERYHSREGRYAAELSKLDVHAAFPQDFKKGKITVGSTGDMQNSWSLTVTRVGEDSHFGAYTLTFTEDGLDVLESSAADIPALAPSPS